MRKKAVAPTPEELELLQQHPGAEAAACQVTREYRKSIAALVDLQYKPKKFRDNDQQLKEWLVPVDQVTVIYGKPSTAFLQAVQTTECLVLHPDALKHADELAKHRWKFAELSADLLAKYAKGEVSGPLREWKAEHGIEFAVNGSVRFKYRVACGAEQCAQKTEWHLKEGDRTTRESAARVYFERVEFSTGARVIVFYVGPHPRDGELEVTLAIPVSEQSV